MTAPKIAALFAAITQAVTCGAVLLSSPLDKDAKGCADLTNHFTHFTIDVEVGTPGQRFSVVADTGSNSLIVPSCVCQQAGKCAKTDRCFTGTNKSKSFRIIGDNQNHPQSMVLSFGSGQIQAVLAEDVVRVGQVEATMTDGLLLMTDRALNIQGPFEGILGLGVPQPPVNMTEQQQAAGGSLQDIMNKIMQSMGGNGGSPMDPGAAVDVPMPPGAGGSMDDVMRKIMEQMQGAMGGGGQGPTPGAIIDAHAQRAADIAKGDILGKSAKGNVTTGIISNTSGGPFVPHPAPSGFLEQANISRFSICFNEGANGVLRLGSKQAPTPHGGIGKQHWGLDFRGVSVNSSSADDTLFCGNAPEKGKQSACGIIPDSGTTVMMGPQDHVTKLLEGICDRWPRCNQNFTKLQAAITAADKAMVNTYGINPFELKKMMSKADVMQILLLDCKAWLTEEEGLGEIPDIHFHIAGSNKTRQTLTLPSRAFIMESFRENITQTMKMLRMSDIGNIPVENITQGNPKDKVCSPAFGVMDYNTKANGPVWIMGTPLFYEFVVGYDVDTDPPSISFIPQTEMPCGSCSKNLNLRANRHPEPFWHPRHVYGNPRLPSIDVTKPL